MGEPPMVALRPGASRCAVPIVRWSVATQHGIHGWSRCSELRRSDTRARSDSPGSSEVESDDSMLLAFVPGGGCAPPERRPVALRRPIGDTPGVSFRDDRNAMLSRMDALERRLARAEQELASSDDARDRLQAERDQLAEKLAEADQRLEQEQRRGRKKSRKRGRRRTRASRKRAWLGIALVVSLLAGGGVLVYFLAKAAVPSASDPAGGLNSLCPRGSGPIALTDWIYREYERGRTNWFFYAAYDPVTGERLVRRELTSQSSGRMPDCIGAAPGVVWIWTEKHGIHGRVPETGEVAIDQGQLLGGLGARLDRVGFSVSQQALILSMKDGRDYRVTAEHQFRPMPLGRDERVPSDLRVATEAIGISRSARRGDRKLPDGRTVRFVGRSSRVELRVGDTQMGPSDWLSPVLVHFPQDGAIAWPEPASLMIVEPTEVGRKRFRISRVRIEDGTVLWSYTPKADDLLISKDASWQPTDTGETLIHFTRGARMIGLDPRTGVERFNLHL